MVTVLTRPPQVDTRCRPRGGDPVGGDEGAVEVDMGVAGGLGCLQRGMQVRRLAGEDVDAFVQVAAGGGVTDVVVAAQLGQAGDLGTRAARVRPACPRSTHAN